MAYARSTRNAFGGPRDAGEGAVRLVYVLSTAGRSQGFHLLPTRKRGEPTLEESEFKALFDSLHPLDLEIARELRSAQAYGFLSDGQVARLLPLLTKRRTFMEGERIRPADSKLFPRARAETNEQGRMELCLGFMDEDGDWYDPSQGKVVAGSQAFWIRNCRCFEIESAEPWQMARWGRTPRIALTKDLTPNRRDQLTRDLRAAGIPEEDLEMLSIQRGPPDLFIAHVWAPEVEGEEPLVQVTLEAMYQGQTVRVMGHNPGSPYLLGAEGADALFERDIAAEEDARTSLRRLGFRFNKETETFLGKQELALNALDPGRKLFPKEWQIIRSKTAPVFHKDLTLRTEVKLLEERGLLDLKIHVSTITVEGDTERTVEALVKMKDLLAWLQSGKKYLRLEDGSYVAPSENFRKGLRLLEDLGADSDRVLISPLCIGLLRLMNNTAAVEAADEATKAWLEELADSNSPKQLEPPKNLNGELRDYQARGLDWLGMLHRHRLTGILADDMGLGKTMQAIALLLKTREDEGPKPSLVIAPTSVVTVWRDEVHRFAPTLKLVLWHGPPKVRHELDISDADVIVTSYGILRRDAVILKEIPFRYVILDEAQSAKNAASQNAAAVRELTSERRLALTGTPIENRPEELWSTFDFLAPGFLGSLRQFRKRYARPIGRGEREPLELLSARVTPLILRRLKGEVAKELPDKIESVVRCQMGEEQQALYDHLSGQLRKEVENKIEQIGINKAHLDILAALTKLRQICCDPELLGSPEGTDVPDSAKLELFEELLREALESGRKVIVFSQFVEMQKRIIKVIKRLGVDPCWLHGGTRERDKVVARFQDPEGPPVIVVSLRAGGTGLTLTRADTVIHYDPWWNPAVERQATDRAHRLGQTQTVNVYKLVCAGTIEERVLELAERKEHLAREILGSEGTSDSKKITTTDVLALLR